MSTFWYILCPGEGGDGAFFDAHDLARNYKVPMARCLVQREGQQVADEYNHLPRLQPDPSGRWIRPTNSRYKGKKVSS